MAAPEATQMANVKRVEQAYVAEIDAALLYASLARVEPDQKRRSQLQSMSDEERRHAVHWAQEMEKLGLPVPKEELSARSRLLAWLAARFGTRAVAPFLITQEREGAVDYGDEPDLRSFASQERDHARVFASLARGGGEIAAAERWHRGGAVNLRAAIFGINDGLVSNLSLVVGVAAAQPSAEFVLLAGIAGLLAGAFSMAGGEYISVQSQREVLQHQLELERLELEESPEDERWELARIYQRKGLPEQDAQRLAASMLADPRVALDTLAREELGLNPENLGSPLWAAGSSFVSFAVGALIPILPYLLVRSLEGAFALSAVGSALILFGVGALLAVLTGRNPLASGGRMLAVGGAAAGVTYLVGKLLGVAIGG